MDISFRIDYTRFNLRARAIVVKDNKLLTIDDKGFYYYLPGGRIDIAENAKTALVREIKEELGLDASIKKCVYVHEALYNKNHEVCFYFLVDIKNLPTHNFTHMEGKKINKFYWLDLDTIDKYTVYPVKIIKLIKENNFEKNIIFD